MTNVLKNFVSVLTLICFMIGSVLTGFGIFESTDVLANQFIIPAQVLNGLTVMFLLYLTSTSTFSPSYKFLIIVLLVGGMLIEVYLTSYAEKKAESIAAYMFLALNFLIRTFLLIDLVQGEWVRPFTRTVKPIQEAVKDIVKEVTPTPEPVSKIIEDKPSTDEIGEYKDKFKAIVREVKSKNPNFDNMTIVRDAWRVIDEAAKAGEFTNEHLKEALDKIKNKDGSNISGVTVGGRKRRS